jgi:hypothetical protein
MDSGFTGNLNGIWGTSPRDVFAVGDGGTILHYDGTKWVKKLQDDQYGILKDVWGSSRNNIFAVGARGIILHSTDAGQTWVPENNPDDALNNLNSIWGRAKNNIYAVGDNGIVLYYDGKNWSVQEPNPATTHLYGVWSCPNPHAYVVGANGFIGGKSWSAIRGWIHDSCTGNGFQGARVQRFNETTQQWQTWCNGITTTGGWYDCTSEQCALSPGTYQFRFVADNYSAQTKDINIIANTWIESYTYLLPMSGYERCISGVISEITTEGGGTFSRVMPYILVKLYKKSCTSWDPTNYEMNASIGGHYHFTIGAGQDGTYKVVPSNLNFNFYPEFDNVEIVIPQDQSTINVYDFTRE